MKIILYLFLLCAPVLAQFNTLGTWDLYGVPDYLEEPGDVISGELLTRIRASLPESHRVPELHPEFLSTMAQTNIYLTEEADVYVTYVHEGAGYKNILGFYTYENGNPPQTIEDIESTMTVIFPNVSNSGSGGGLNPGDKVKIGTFSENTVIGWFIAANGFANLTITNGHWMVFSDKILNPESDTTLQQHNVLLNDIGEDRVILAFEDVRRDYGSCDQDFNDAIFYVTATPNTAISYENISIIEDPENETRIDLQLTKTADNIAPFDGDEIKFTVTLTNNGPANASDIVVADPVPQGLEFLSSSAQSGTYDVNTGLWEIDNLAVGGSVSLTITTKLTLAAISQPAFDLAYAKDYNLFLFDELSQPSADTEGKIAVGGNVYLSSYSVGDKLPPSGGETDVLIAGKNLTFLSGNVTGGNVVYGEGTNLPANQVSIGDGVIRQDYPIDFAAAHSHFKSLSGALSEYPENGRTEYQNSGIQLFGSDPFLNVFHISGDNLTAATSFDISAPNGSVVLVNISGDNINWNGALNITGTVKSNVLYNFYESNALRITNIAVLGTILAPNTVLDYPAGEINGQVIARSVYGAGQFNMGDLKENYFVGNIPVSEVLVNTALVESAGQFDIDTTNNHDKVTLTISGFADPGNTGNVNWQQIGEITSGDIIWVNTRDTEGNLLAGTWGGAINRSDDNGVTWERLNSDMNVAFIWSLAVDGDNIYAGTERGVYYSPDNGENWNSTGLASYDVRSILVKEGKVFAGTWGAGLFTSTDNGNTWNSSSRDVTNQSVHALVQDSDGNIFAGTFNDGIYKSSDDGESFVKQEIAYPHIWSLAVSGNKIFAGTYGGGVYYSENSGDNWSAVNNNLSATHIYSIYVDEQENVYVTSWNSGVFVLIPETKTPAWGPLGMNGLEISSIWYDESANELYASSGDGIVYKNNNPLLDVEQENDLITDKFELNQNYPNPFNPGTTIKFSVAKEGNYRLSVFNLLGEVVSVVKDDYLTPGSYSEYFDGKNLSSGIYFYSLTGNGLKFTKKMILIK